MISPKVKDIGICINCWEEDAMLDTAFCSSRCLNDWKNSGGKIELPSHPLFCMKCEERTVEKSNYCAEHTEELRHMMEFYRKKRKGLLEGDEQFLPYYMARHRT